MITSGTIWTHAHAYSVFCAQGGKASARSPRHYPIELARKRQAELRAERKAAKLAAANAQAHLDTARALLNSSREQ
jgi:hypothetical protein